MLRTIRVLICEAPVPHVERDLIMVGSSSMAWFKDFTASLTLGPQPLTWAEGVLAHLRRTHKPRP